MLWHPWSVFPLRPPPGADCQQLQALEDWLAYPALGDGDVLINCVSFVASRCLLVADAWHCLDYGDIWHCTGFDNLEILFFCLHANFHSMYPRCRQVKHCELICSSNVTGFVCRLIGKFWVKASPIDTNVCTTVCR